MRKQSTKQRRRKSLEAEYRIRFREEGFDLWRQEHGSVECIRKDKLGHRCTGRLDPHHVIPAQTLTAWHLTLRWTDEEKFALEYDPRNCVPICRGLHDQITVRARGECLFREELPTYHSWFMNDYPGLEHLLAREAPSLHSEDSDRSEVSGR